MTSSPVPERFTTHKHRALYLFGFVMIFAVALRRIAELDEAWSIGLALGLLSLFTVLYASESWLVRRFPGYPPIYFTLQFVLVQVLGLFEVYQDTWALLYTVLGIQVAYVGTRKAALMWAIMFAGSTLVTLTAEFGLLSGMGRASAYIVIALFLVLYDSQFAQREDAHTESQVLLSELRLAHQELGEYAAQAEALAGARERDRIIRELHDSAGQKIFAIQLATESTLLLLDKEPGRAAEQLSLLQEQTQAALMQMRQLIEQWNPR